MKRNLRSSAAEYWSRADEELVRRSTAVHKSIADLLIHILAHTARPGREAEETSVAGMNAAIGDGQGVRQVSSYKQVSSYRQSLTDSITDSIT